MASRSGAPFRPGFQLSTNSPLGVCICFQKLWSLSFSCLSISFSSSRFSIYNPGPSRPRRGAPRLSSSPPTQPRRGRDSPVGTGQRTPPRGVELLFPFLKPHRSPRSVFLDCLLHGQGYCHLVLRREFLIQVRHVFRSPATMQASNLLCHFKRRCNACAPSAERLCCISGGVPSYHRRPVFDCCPHCISTHRRKPRCPRTKRWKEHWACPAVDRRM